MGLVKVTELARQYGISSETLKRLLVKNGVPITNSGPRSPLLVEESNARSIIEAVRKVSQQNSQAATSVVTSSTPATPATPATSGTPATSSISDTLLQDPVSSFYAQYGNVKDAKFEVYRYDETTRIWQYADESPVLPTRQDIKNKFGGGRYKIRAYIQNKLLESPDIYIYTPKDTPPSGQISMPQIQQFLPPAQPAIASAKQDSTMKDIIEAMTKVYEAVSKQPNQTSATQELSNSLKLILDYLKTAPQPTPPQDISAIAQLLLSRIDTIERNPSLIASQLTPALTDLKIAINNLQNNLQRSQQPGVDISQIISSIADLLESKLDRDLEREKLYASIKPATQPAWPEAELFRLVREMINEVKHQREELLHKELEFIKQEIRNIKQNTTADVIKSLAPHAPAIVAALGQLLTPQQQAEIMPALKPLLQGYQQENKPPPKPKSFLDRVFESFDRIDEFARKLYQVTGRLRGLSQGQEKAQAQTQETQAKQETALKPATQDLTNAGESAVVDVTANVVDTDVGKQEETKDSQILEQVNLEKGGIMSWIPFLTKYGDLMLSLLKESVNSNGKITPEAFVDMLAQHVPSVYSFLIANPSERLRSMINLAPLSAEDKQFLASDATKQFYDKAREYAINFIQQEYQQPQQ
jgi:DNA-binding phage protein